MHSPQHRDNSLDLMRALWKRRKWLALLAFGACFLGSASVIVALPDLYRATATVVVQQDIPEPREGAGFEFEPRLHVVNEAILSRARLQALIDRFDLYPALRREASPEDVIERMRRDIRLKRNEVEQRWGRSATVSFTLSYQGWQPRTVAQVTNQLVSYYVQENERIRGRQAAGTQAAGAIDQIAPLKRQLAEMRTRFSDRYPDVIKLKAEIAALERMRREGSLASAAPPGPAAAGDGAPPAARPGAPERPQFHVLDAAIVPYEPFAPNRLRLLVMALILSFGAAAAAVLVAEQLDTSFHRVDDLRAFTSVPVLASVLRINTRGDIWRGRLRFGFTAIVSGLAFAVIAQAGYAFGRNGQQLVWILTQPGG